MGPFIKSKDSSNKIMIRLLLSLIPFIMFSFYKDGINLYMNDEVGVLGLLYPLIFIFIGLISSIIFEIIYKLIKKEKEYNIDCVFIGLVLPLMLPINTPIYLLVLGILISILCKNLIKYDINTILIGYLFIFIFTFEPYNIKSNLIDKFMIINLIICFISYIYLYITKTIKWRIPIVYAITVFIMTYVIGSSLEQNLTYPIYHLLNGGLLFASIYLVTDSNTSCVTPIGQILQGIFLGILTVLFRYIGIEGIIFSILIMSFFISILDSIGSRSRFNVVKSFVLFLIAWILIIAVCLFFSISNKNKELMIDNNDINIYERL